MSVARSRRAAERGMTATFDVVVLSGSGSILKRDVSIERNSRIINSNLSDDREDEMKPICGEMAITKVTSNGRGSVP